MGDWTDNPFGQAEETTPFADPSVTSSAAVEVPEYNPFDDPATKAASAGAAPSAVASGAAAFATAAPAQDEVPAWATDTPAHQEVVAVASPSGRTKSKKQLKAEQKAESKRQKEYAQREQQAAARENKGDGKREANFPPVPMCMRKGFVKPCFHLDIKAEIPLRAQRTVRHGFFLWEFTVFCLFFNFIANLATLAGGAKGTDTSCGLATAWLILNVPSSYICWYHPMYNAFRRDSSMRYGWFFFVMSFQFAISIFFSIGIPGTGAAGIWVAISTSKDDVEAGIVVFTCAAMWMLHSLLTFWIIARSIGYYRSTGGSLEKMQREATREAVTAAASNDVVQNAAKKAAADAAQDAVFGSPA